MTDYDAWHSHRASLGQREANGGSVHPDEWHGSDDAAVDLLERFAVALQLVADVLGDPLFEAHFTCDEAENLYGAIHLIDPAAAERFMVMHASTDDDDDNRHEAYQDEPLVTPWKWRYK